MLHSNERGLDYFYHVRKRIRVSMESRALQLPDDAPQNAKYRPPGGTDFHYL